MVGELVVEEKWWMISGSDGINDLGLMDGCVCGGNNCGELNGWFRSFCNCCVFSIVVFVSSPFSVLRSLLLVSLPILTMSTGDYNNCSAHSQRLSLHSQRLSLHSQQHSPTHSKRTSNSLPKNKQLTPKEQEITQLKRTTQRIKRGSFTERTLYSGYLSSCKREFIIQIASPELLCQNQPIWTQS